MQSSSIIYTLIARGSDVILVDYTSAVGNFGIISRNILKKFKQNSRLSYSYNAKYIFHYINENNFSFLCIADDTFARLVAFNYLDDIKEKFYDNFPPEIRNKQIQYGLSNQFADVIKTKMQFYNTNPEANKLNEIKSNLNEVKDLMVENIDKILEREQKVEMLVKKTATMNKQATNIKKQAIQVRREAQWKNMKFKLIVAAIVVVVLYTILAMICGGLNLPSC